jgi:hypothetical protein
MTVKGISIAVNKKERSIHNWIKKLSAINAQVSAKIAQAKETSKPAEYDLEETCSIISEEMGKPRPIIDDAKYGRLRTYHISVLEKLFEDSEEEEI